MKKIAKSHAVYFLIVALLFLNSCASIASHSGFLENYTPLQSGVDFKEEFFDPAANFSKYTKVKVTPTNIKFFDPEKKAELELADIDRLALLFSSDIECVFAEKFLVIHAAAKADERTLVISPAITSATKANILLNWAVLLIPIPFLSLVINSSGSASFEAKMTDGATGKLLATTVERRRGNFDLKSIFIGSYVDPFTHAEEILNTWAKHLLEFVETRQTQSASIR
ncbi:MAG TPA: DUF3313 family protein [Candidatus Omnitrophota bacterium]|nr:DUF3313 family protein [Candidatus Omnitrophota bacterium]